MLSAAWHRYIFLFGLIGLAAGMLFGTVPTSIPQIILAANWLLEGNFKWKWQQLKSNKIFWVLASFFLLHVIGMTYTENIQQGLDDLRNKMPLLVLPLILFSTKPLSIKEFKLLFGFFFLSVFFYSTCNLGVSSTSLTAMSTAFCFKFRRACWSSSKDSTFLSITGIFCWHFF